jgi:DNA-directed RNA polymerase subunit M/transcription elongation factor TFIIS
MNKEKNVELGWKPTKEENPNFKCQKCGSDDTWYYIWESSDGAHEDVRYKCDGCGRQWWIEGSDY